jgi:hypothetical protein
MSEWLFGLGNRIRQELQRLADEDDELNVNQENLRGGCGIASVVLYKVLNDKGIHTTIKCGRFHPPNTTGKDLPHCWVVIKVNGVDYLLDVTATQFNADHEEKKFKKSIVLLRESDSKCCWKPEDDKIFLPGNMNAVKKHFYRWPDGIKPRLELVHQIMSVAGRMHLDI